MAKRTTFQEEPVVVECLVTEYQPALGTVTESSAPLGPSGQSDDLSGLSPKRHTSRTALFDFANAQSIKESVRKQKKVKNKYDVKDQYHETGWFQKIAKDHWFEHFTLGVIAANACWIGIDTDHNHSKDGLNAAEPIFILADCAFFGYFSFELFVRFMAFKTKSSCLKDGWFCFDSTLVFLYFLDPFLLSFVSHQTGGSGMDVPTAILRLFRLARLSRLVRMLRSLPELMILVKGMFVALASVGYMLGLLIVVAYVFAIALCQLSQGHEFRELYFTCVPHGMYSLAIFGTFLDDLAAFGDPIKAESTVCLVLVALFIIIASMTLMNMLIGVLCEVITGVAVTEKETAVVDKVYSSFEVVYEMLDKNGNGSISITEFNQMMTDEKTAPLAMKALDIVGVDAETMIDVSDEYFFYLGQPIELNFQEFMEMVMELRGSQECRIQDVVMLGKRFSKKFHDLKKKLRVFSANLDRLESIW